jgi:hypothetical protein
VFHRSTIIRQPAVLANAVVVIKSSCRRVCETVRSKYPIQLQQLLYIGSIRYYVFGTALYDEISSTYLHDL